MMDLVSIIVPIYNSEKYLDKCIYSISNQTYDNLEIILIDDGSTDGSIKILEKWREIDDRIKIVTQKNSGVAKARNKGLEISKGRYICFFDSDDWIEEDMIYQMQYEISIRNADLAYCNFLYEYTHSSKIGIIDEDKKIMERKWKDTEIYFHYLSPNSSSGIITNKMYCAEIIKKNKLKFIDSSKIGGEDSLFNLCYFASVRESVFINKGLYHYIQIENSQIHKNRPEMIRDYVNLIDELNNYIKKNNFLYIKKVIPHLFYHYYTLGIETSIRNGVDNNSIIYYMKKANSKSIFANLMKKFIKFQMTKETSFGNLSRRIRTIFFAVLSILKINRPVLFFSRIWLRLRKSDRYLKDCLFIDIELKTKPLVSIIIPVHNSEKYIKESIQSVKEQSYKKWELIIVDDGSTDKSLEFIKTQARDDNRVKILRNSQNKGVNYSRNKGIELSKGEWIAFLDSDDKWTRQKLEIQLKEAEMGEKNFIFSNIFIKKRCYNPVLSISKIPKKITFDDLKKRNIIPLSTVLIRRILINKQKFEREDLHEDYIIWLKILSKGIIAYGIDKPLAIIRMRKDSRSSKKIYSILKTYKLYRFLGINIIESLQHTFTNSLRALKKYIYVEIKSRE